MKSLETDARTIWQAGVDAVRAEILVADAIHCADECLTICGHTFPLSEIGRIAVVGAGKAGAGMAAAVETALGEPVVEEKVHGWVNVPADCLRPLAKIHLHAGRPAGINEPTAEGVTGSREILNIVGNLGPDDLCLVLISGGGSALLPAPCPPLTLEDKQAVTRFLMSHGADIVELNTVRKQLSSLKGGGLARASSAGQMITLIISDIVGDPLDMIASGPTVPDASSTGQALQILEKFDATPPTVPQSVFEFLNDGGRSASSEAFPGHVSNHIIGSNQTALQAAAERAKQLGYEVVSLGSGNAGEANAEGRALADRCRELRDDCSRQHGVCILSGGEPVVDLVETDLPRRGGRNQQLVLAGLLHLAGDGMQNIVLLSGGTDGEDGPTDAAGAWADSGILETARQKNLDLQSFLDINNAYSLFERVGGLLITGPTHTNVMDLRVGLVGASGH